MSPHLTARSKAACTKKWRRLTDSVERDAFGLQVFGQETGVIGVELCGGEIVEAVAPDNGADANLYQRAVLPDGRFGPLRSVVRSPAVQQVGYAARLINGDLTALSVGDTQRQLFLGAPSSSGM
jgi:hypothetical protein